MVPKENIDVNQLLLEIKYDIQRNSSTRIIIRSNMPTLYTERVPLTQIFTNLIVNAVKYHDKPDGFVKVYYKVEDDHYRFFVQDDGPGIKPVYHKKIFTIFQTLQEIDTHESIGAGLAIVKKILDERKLTIQLISEPGKGSVFSFTWPAH
jgi:signal transduction histidine kinase